MAISDSRGCRRFPAARSHFLRHLLPYGIGLFLALAVSLSARSVRFDRDRAFYPVVLIVIASYYVLFAAMAGSVRALVVETLIMSGFMLVAVAGFRRSLWLVVAALLAHGVLDLVHSRFVTNPGVPSWWPAFCLTYDMTAAAFLAGLLRSRPVGAASQLPPAVRSE